MPLQAIRSPQKGAYFQWIRPAYLETSSGLSDNALNRLRPQERTLLVELKLTAENAKTLLSADLQSEYLREFENESPELLERVFRAWRRRSKFMPTIAEVFALLDPEKFSPI